MGAFSRTDRQTILYYVVIGLATLVAKAWVVAPDNGFLWDDYSQLMRAFYVSPIEYFSVLPAQLYNDRPVGDIFYFLTSRYFHLNPVLTHTVQLAIHLYSALLAAYIMDKLGMHRWVAVLCLFVFVASPVSTRAVQWTAAFYDLGSMAFVMTALALLVCHIFDPRPNGTLTAGLILFFYYLSVRTKEMSLFLPLIMVLFVYYAGLRAGRGSDTLRRNFSVLLPCFGLFCLLFLQFISLKTSMPMNVTTAINSPYYLSFDIRKMLAGLLRYLELYFGFQNLLCYFCIAISFFFTEKKRWGVIAAMIFLSLLLVLPMVNSNHPLYLYIPSFFIVLLGAEFLDGLVAKLRVRPAFVGGFCVLSIIALGVFFDHVDTDPRMTFNRAFWLSTIREHKRQLTDFSRHVPCLDGNERILVYNATGNNNIFYYYGPGDSIRLFSGLRYLKIDYVPAEAGKPDFSRYDIVLDYNQGDFVFKKLGKSTRRVNYMFDGGTGAGRIAKAQPEATWTGQVTSGGLGLERNRSGEKTVWVGKMAEVSVPKSAASAGILIRGYLPFANHQKANKIDSVVLKSSVAGKNEKTTAYDKDAEISVLITDSEVKNVQPDEQGNVVIRLTLNSEYVPAAAGLGPDKRNLAYLITYIGVP